MNTGSRTRVLVLGGGSAALAAIAILQSHGVDAKIVDAADAKAEVEIEARRTEDQARLILALDRLSDKLLEDAKELRYNDRSAYEDFAPCCYAAEDYFIDRPVSWVADRLHAQCITRIRFNSARALRGIHGSTRRLTCLKAFKADRRQGGRIRGLVGRPTPAA